jgi:hypothetical protein
MQVDYISPMAAGRVASSKESISLIASIVDMPAAVAHS